MTNSVLSRKIYLICVFICSTTSTSCPSCPQRITWTTVRRRWMRSMQLSQTWRSPWREERRPTRWCWNTPPNYTEIWQPHTPIGLYHTSALKITSAVDFISAVAIAQDWHDLLTDYHHNTTTSLIRNDEACHSDACFITWKCMCNTSHLTTKGLTIFVKEMREYNTNISH